MINTDTSFTTSSDEREKTNRNSDYTVTEKADIYGGQVSLRIVYYHSLVVKRERQTHGGYDNDKDGKCNMG